MYCLVSDTARELDVTAARADREARGARHDLPALGDDVPDGEVVAGELECDRRGLARAKVHGVEALEVHRRGARRRRRGCVQLGNLRARLGAGVGEREGDGDDGVVEPAREEKRDGAGSAAGLGAAWAQCGLPGVEGGARPDGLARAAGGGAADLEVRVGEGRVREPEAELEAGLDVVLETRSAIFGQLCVLVCPLRPLHEGALTASKWR